MAGATSNSRLASEVLALPHLPTIHKDLKRLVVPTVNLEQGARDAHASVARQASVRLLNVSVDAKYVVTADEGAKLATCALSDCDVARPARCARPQCVIQFGPNARRRRRDWR